MLVNQPRRLLFLSLCASAWLVGVVTAPASHGFWRQRPGDGDYPPTSRVESNTSWTISGAVSANGIALPGASIVATENGTYQTLAARRDDVFSKASGNLAGEFELRIRSGLTVVAHAPGFAPVCLPAPEGTALDIDLTMGRTIHGTVKMPDGKPAKNAIVKPVLIARPRTKTELEKVSSEQRTRYPQVNFATVAYPKFGMDAATETDEKGNFVLRGLPDQRIGLAIEKDGYLGEVVYLPAEGESAEEAAWKPDRFVENGFSSTLRECFNVRIKGVGDAGEEVAIKTIRVEMITSDSHLFFSRTFETREPQPLVSLRALNEGFALWLEPEDQRYLGRRIEIKPVPESGSTVRQVRFQRGIELTGQVTSLQDGSPIGNVLLAWKGLDSQKIYDAEGNFMLPDTRTDEAGQFSAHVPDTDATFAVVGRVPGFVSISDISTLWQLNDSELSERFAVRLSAGEIDDNKSYDFQLTPAPSFHLTIQAPGQIPLSGAVVNASIIRPGTAGPIREEHYHFTEATDENGMVTLSDWYTDASKMKRPMAIFGYPTSVEVFSPTGILQGEATLPIPQPDDFVDKEITIVLDEGANLEGAIVDQFGNPLGDIQVKATTARHFQSEGGQTWETRTRTDGRFRLSHLPAAGKVVLSVDATKFETVAGNAVLLAVEEDREIGSTKLLDTIECLDLRMLSEPIEPLAIAPESPDQAIAAIRDYVARHLERIPEKPEKYFSSESYADPIPTFRSKVLSAVVSELKRLSLEHAGSEFEFQLLKKVVDATYQGAAESRGVILGTGEREARKWLFDQLIAEHANRPDATETIEKAIKNRDSQVAGQRLHWQAYGEATNRPETKQSAFLQAAWGTAVEASNRLQGWSSDEAFEMELDRLTQTLDLALAAGPVPVELLDSFETKFKEIEEYHRKQVAGREDYLRSQQTENPTAIRSLRVYRKRLERLAKAIEERIKKVD